MVCAVCVLCVCVYACVLFCFNPPWRNYAFFQDDDDDSTINSTMRIGSKTAN